METILTLLGQLDRGKTIWFLILVGLALYNPVFSLAVSAAMAITHYTIPFTKTFIDPID